MIDNLWGSVGVDERGVTPVVGKALEAGLVVLYLAMVSVTLYSGVVPDYRGTAGAEVGDRTLAGAAERVGSAVPPNATGVDARRRVDLPRTIADRGYEIRVDGRTLVLAHPNSAVGGRARLALPDSVVRVEGRWSSREPAVVRVASVDGGLAVRLATGD